MKKVLFALIFTMFGFSVFSQSLELSYGSHSTPLNYGDTITIDSLSTVNELVASLNVKNADIVSRNVYCRKQYIYVVPNTVNTFCWAGSCYPPTTFISSSSTAIGSGQTNSEFTAHYDPLGINGTSIIMYSFSIFHGGGDSAWVYVKFNVTQTLQIYTDNNVFLHNGDIITIDSLSTDTILTSEIISHLKVINTNINTKNVSCEKQEQYIVPGTQNDFNWAGTNVPNSIYVSPLDTLNGGDTAEFNGNYMPYNKIGTSIIKYIFRVENGDSAWINVKYNANYSGISNNSFSSSISAPYPNPANSNVSINYSILNSNNASIQIYNIYGILEKQFSVQNTNGVVNINVSDLHSGIYFYSLNLNGVNVKTNSFIVSH